MITLTVQIAKTVLLGLVPAVALAATVALG